jgi:hypothetical protein
MHFGYRLKPDFKYLFSQLASGEALQHADAFVEPGMPRQQDRLARANLERDQIIQKLIDAGFVEGLDFEQFRDANAQK